LARAGYRPGDGVMGRGACTHRLAAARS